MTSENGSAPLSVEQMAELRAALSTYPGMSNDCILATVFREVAPALLAAAEENAKLRAEVERLTVVQEVGTESGLFWMDLSDEYKQRIATLTAALAAEREQCAAAAIRAAASDDNTKGG